MQNPQAYPEAQYSISTAPQGLDTAGRDGKTFVSPSGPALMACRQAVGHNALPRR